MSKPIVGVVTAMWKRHELTSIIFENLANLRRELADIIDLRLCVAGSEGEASRQVAEKHGFEYIEVPNEPLGAKWNAALSLLRGQDFDGICVLGSDDLVNAAYFKMVADSIQRGEKLFGLGSFYILDRFFGRLCHWLGYAPPRHKEPIGLGRFIHKDYIEALDWKLWGDDKTHGLDKSMKERIADLSPSLGLPLSFGLKELGEYGIVAVDVKHIQQMWPYEHMAIASRDLMLHGDPRGFLGQHYAPAVLDQLFKPCAQLAEPVPDLYLPPWEAGGTSQFAPYALRRNITYFPADLNNEEELVRLFYIFSTLRKEGVQLHIPIPLLNHISISNRGVFGYTIGNMHSWRNLFRVYVLAASLENACIALDLVMHNNLVVCTEDMRQFIEGTPEGMPFFAKNFAEAITLAQELHNNEKLWKASTLRMQSVTYSSGDASRT